MEGVLEASQRQRQRPDQPTSPPSLLPSALPADIPPSHAHPPRARSSSPTPPPPFSPFFTLITSTSTSTSASTSVTSTTHHHPHTHYIFSDDASDAITTAALDVLEPRGLLIPNPSDPPPRPPPSTERYLLLDLDPTGTRITRAQSMSPAFQILTTSIVPAPTWETGDQGAGAHPAGSGGGGGGGGGLMLKIVGTEGMAYGGQPGRGNGAEAMAGLEAVVGEYEARMGELRRVIEGAGGGR